VAGFFRRFSNFPTTAQINAIEGVTVVDLNPPGVFGGILSGILALVGEWSKGPFNTPTEVEGDQTIRAFGGFSGSVSDPLGFDVNRYGNGNAFCWLKGKSFSRIVLVRADLDLAEGITLKVTGTPTPLAKDLLIPAGTRVRDPAHTTREFALSADVVIAAGTSLTTAAHSAYSSTATSYSTRTVTGVPVYSTQGVAENAVGDVTQVDSTDLARAGIGAGTSLPSIVVACSTGVLDSSTANTDPLTPLTSSEIDAAYSTAIDSTKPNSDATSPTSMIGIIASARQSAAIRAALKANAIDSSAIGYGRVALLRAPLGTVSADARGSTDTGDGYVAGSGVGGVGANRTDRVVFCYPHYEQYISDVAAFNSSLTGNVMLGADSAMAVLLSQLNPEENPGQETDFLGYGLRRLEPGLTTTGLPTAFEESDYELFKAAGIAALRYDPSIGKWVFQSGVTADLTNAPIARRRMRDYVEDSVAAIMAPYVKKLGVPDRKDSLVGEVYSFLDGLLSPENTARQRIADFLLDSKSGNSEAQEALGIFVLIGKVKTLASMDQIVFQAQVGETVTIETSV